jgi:hypothetical protein
LAIDRMAYLVMALGFPGAMTRLRQATVSGLSQSVAPLSPMDSLDTCFAGRGDNPWTADAAHRLTPTCPPCPRVAGGAAHGGGVRTANTLIFKRKGS